MSDYDEDCDFYEEDEPLEDIIAAFERGEKGVTAPPIALVREAQQSANRADAGSSQAWNYNVATGRMERIW